MTQKIMGYGHKKQEVISAVKRGRPKLKDDRGAIINARFTNAEMELIYGFMGEEGFTTKSALMREAVLVYISKTKGKLKTSKDIPSELIRRVDRMENDKAEAINRLSKIHEETERLIAALRLKEEQEIDFGGQEHIVIPEHVNPLGEKVKSQVKKVEHLTSHDRYVLQLKKFTDGMKKTKGAFMEMKVKPKLTEDQKEKVKSLKNKLLS